MVKTMVCSSLLSAFCTGRLQNSSCFPHARRQAFDFFEKSSQIPGYVGSLDGRMPHQLALQKHPKRPATDDYSKIFPCIEPFVQM